MDKKFGDLSLRELRKFCTSADCCDNCVLDKRYGVCAHDAIMRHDFDTYLFNKQIEVIKNES